MSRIWKIVVVVIVALFLAGLAGGLIAAFGGTEVTTSAATAATSTTAPASVSTTPSATPASQATALSAPAATIPDSSTQPPAASVDRHDPESVLRAYFSAWSSADWEGQKSFMAGQYANLEPEPAESLQIVDLRRAEGSASHCLYYVTFDFAPKGRVVSMESGRYDWSYDLNWDETRQSWLITNYGEG